MIQSLACKELSFFWTRNRSSGTIRENPLLLWPVCASLVCVCVCVCVLCVCVCWCLTSCISLHLSVCWKVSQRWTFTHNQQPWPQTTQKKSLTLILFLFASTVSKLDLQWFGVTLQSTSFQQLYDPITRLLCLHPVCSVYLHQLVVWANPTIRSYEVTKLLSLTTSLGKKLTLPHQGRLLSREAVRERSFHYFHLYRSNCQTSAFIQQLCRL